MFKLALIYIFILLHFISNAKNVKSNQETFIHDSLISIKQFGAKGDGITNDYPAFLAIAKYINRKGSGNIFIPKGIYYIGVFYNKVNENKDIEFTNCNNLKIIGDHATIILNGQFKRTADYRNKKYWYSYARTIIPLSFNNCTNVEVEGLEINGNVSQITRDSNVVENQGYLLMLNNCENVEIKNMFLHHSQTDGIYIIGTNSNSKNVNMSNVISANNGRQGMSVIGLLNGKFDHCQFINTGITGGVYGYHSPTAGVDIEPHPETVVEKILFLHCIFKNNKGGNFYVLHQLPLRISF
ncbi:MAG: glycosyl hydrolase family 28-related protein [Segetibacter sp.]